MSNGRLWVGICCGLVAALRPSAAQTFDPGAEPAFAAAVLVEAESGAVLFAYHANAPRSPASTQKLLLQLVVMDLVKSGKFALDEPVRVSARASRMGGSQVFLKEGEAFSLNEMMEAISIPSANDACVAVAEHIGGSVKGFVDMMNQRADDLKLNGTRCVNVHGLDDTPKQSGNKTTAHDLAHITRGLLAHPEILAWSAVRYKPFRDGRFMLYNTNKLLGRFRGLDGIKTGYTKRAGSCLVATAERGDMRLISVILGGRSDKIRDAETRRLLSWGFNNFFARSYRARRREHGNGCAGLGDGTRSHSAYRIRRRGSPEHRATKTDPPTDTPSRPASSPGGSRRETGKPDRIPGRQPARRGGCGRRQERGAHGTLG